MSLYKKSLEICILLHQNIFGSHCMLVKICKLFEEKSWNVKIENTKNPSPYLDNRLGSYFEPWKPFPGCLQHPGKGLAWNLWLICVNFSS
jgi:hypothetical protein